MNYRYMTTQIQLDVKNSLNHGTQAAESIQQLINSWAAEGWEFCSIDLVEVVPETIFGNSKKPHLCNIVTFRKELK